MMSFNSSYILKLYFNKEIRRYSESTRCLQELQKKIRSLFSIESEFSLYYWDEDNDYVGIHDSSSFREALRQNVNKSKAFKIYIESPGMHAVFNEKRNFKNNNIK